MSSKANKLSEICADISQVSLASVVIPFTFDKYNPELAVFGIIITFMFWTFSYNLVGR